MSHTEKHNIPAVLLSILLFFTFSMVHEFDWLLPPSPVATTVASPGIAEEIGCEDEIEHEDSFVVISFSNETDTAVFFSVTRLFNASVLTPPPDIA